MFYTHAPKITQMGDTWHLVGLASPSWAKGWLALFTDVRGETVWKIGMYSEFGLQEAAEKGPRGPIGRF